MLFRLFPPDQNQNQDKPTTFTHLHSTPPSTGPVIHRPGFAIPGLWDGHGHLLQYGEFLHSADLFGCTSYACILDRLAAYLALHPEAGTPQSWLRGVGWDQNILGSMPTAGMLEGDARLAGRYVMLDRVDVHCTWVSRAVLDLLPREVGDVPGGEIVREPGMGVFCDNAMDLVVRLWTRPDGERKRGFVRSAMAELNKVGVVGMHDAGVVPRDLEMFEGMVGEEGWSVRVYAMVECEERNTFCPGEAPWVERADGMLVVRSVKLFGDGALGSWGSALLAPYSDRPSTSGSLLINATALTAVATSWAQAGYQVNIHAIGDLANRHAISALTTALEAVCPPSPSDPSPNLAECQSRHRFRIEHSQIISPPDQERMHALGILPSIQPTHATSDSSYAEARLGPERIASSAYRMKSLLDLNPVLGSDFPVEPPSPFEGIYAAVTRRSPRTGKGPEGWEGGWHAEEALSLEEAVRGFTVGAAHGGFMEGKAGVIKEGAYADWVVLDRELGGYAVEELRAMKVKETWVGGRRVYEREDGEVKEDL
ncbi:amidohydrolase family protein [Cercophora newfieldiana]|uniref:Amidohydrolase family protein n=1 Tax=Cercophora newfieldiana TaxID=92897 RepID=A0AA39Y440_9PEZI|nr:amidohydrolase family protein [Cercophora newfieldiana]